MIAWSFGSLREMWEGICKLNAKVSVITRWLEEVNRGKVSTRARRISLKSWRGQSRGMMITSCKDKSRIRSSVLVKASWKTHSCRRLRILQQLNFDQRRTKRLTKRIWKVTWKGTKTLISLDHWWSDQHEEESCLIWKHDWTWKKNE